LGVKVRTLRLRQTYSVYYRKSLVFVKRRERLEPGVQTEETIQVQNRWSIFRRRRDADAWTVRHVLLLAERHDHI
jgi:hypothetical protein